MTTHTVENVKEKRALVHIGLDANAAKEISIAVNSILLMSGIDEETKRVALKCLTDIVKIDDLTITNCHFENRES